MSIADTKENLDIFEAFSSTYARERQEKMSLRDYLLEARDNAIMYASSAERMIAAIGEPQFVDTSRDPRLSRIFFNRTIKRYPNFEGFFGMEDTIERIVGYFKHAAQGLEERRQILYLLGPVGGGKSSLAERLKELMEKEPIYVLKAGDQISPVFETPLGLFRTPELQGMLEERYGIERHRLKNLVMSPWAVKRLDEFEGDISKFEVVRLFPSKLRQIAIAKTEPGDENNQDISSLVGKVDIRKLEHYSARTTPDAYSYLGRPLPRQSRPSRIRRDVQGADQGAASAADGDAGRQLYRHRNARADPVPGHYSRALERSRMADVQGEQEQRGVPRPHPRRDGALLPARHRRNQDLRKALARTRSSAPCRARPRR